MPTLLQLQKLPWKGDGGWKKVSLRHFLADLKIAYSEKKCVLGHPIAVIAYFQTHYDYGPQKISFKLAV